MMSELRIILLLLGCLFLVALYCWEVFFRADKKKRNEFLDAIDELPDSPSINTEHFDDASTYARPLLNSNNIAQQKNEDTFYSETTPTIHTDNYSSTELEETDIPSLKKDIQTLIETDNQIHNTAETISINTDESLSSNNSFSANQEVISDAQPIITEDSNTMPDDMNRLISDIERESAQADTDSITQTPASHQSADLVMLYITSPAQTMFNGLSISKAADEVGMVYGHMNIFHHFGPGKLHSGQPLFSMANMFEPGAFDLGRMADLKTKGIVLFMYSPASIEAAVVFELYLNTARRIAEYLNGELRTNKNLPLDNLGIEQLRQQAEALSKQDI